MSEHKTKLFKKMFQSNADMEIHFAEEKKARPFLSEDTFVPLMGQMWDKAKQKYMKRNKKEAIEFAEYIVAKVILDEFPTGKYEEIYDKWKSTN